MKTKVRIQVGEINRNIQTQPLFIQVLAKRYVTSQTLEVIGTITMQRNTDYNKGFKWYGLKYVIDTDKPDHILQWVKSQKNVPTFITPLNPEKF